MSPSCTIVIPCYNDAARFPLERFRTYVQADAHVWFLPVNDGSRDRTIDALRQAQAGLEDRVDVLDQTVNRGKSEAVRAGVLAALERKDCTMVGF